MSINNAPSSLLPRGLASIRLFFSSFFRIPPPPLLCSPSSVHHARVKHSKNIGPWGVPYFFPSQAHTKGSPNYSDKRFCAFRVNSWWSPGHLCKQLARLLPVNSRKNQVRVPVPLPPHFFPFHVKWPPAHSLQCPHSPGDTISRDLNSFLLRLASMCLLYSLPSHKGSQQIVGSSSGLQKLISRLAIINKPQSVNKGQREVDIENGRKQIISKRTTKENACVRSL